MSKNIRTRSPKETISSLTTNVTTLEELEKRMNRVRDESTFGANDDGARKLHMFIRGFRAGMTLLEAGIERSRISAKIVRVVEDELASASIGATSKLERLWSEMSLNIAKEVPCEQIFDKFEAQLMNGENGTVLCERRQTDGSDESNRQGHHASYEKRKRNQDH